MPETMILNYGSHQIEYQLSFEDRKNLSISVLPSKEVVVKAPAKSELEDVKKRVQRKASWIFKQIRYFDIFHPLQPPRKYISGETHYYTGRQYRLRIRKNSTEVVKLVGKFFMVYTKEPENRDQVRLLLSQWYADHAKAYLDERVKIYLEKIPGLDVRMLNIKYKYLNKEWGLKNTDDSITFNIELIKTPIQCIDYLIVHELCHLVQPHHDDRFYGLLKKVLPDWQERKKRLEFFGSFK
jgi:predicted metal-dependent hydrolase